MPNVTYNDHPEDTSPNDGDFFPFWDVVASAARKLSWSNLRSLVTGYSSPQSNILINGDFDVWQRGTSFAAMANNTRIVDRYKYQLSGTMVHTASRDTDVPTASQSGNKSNYSLKLDCTTADASIAASDFCIVATFIEGFDYAFLKDQTVTFSFWVKAVKTGTYCVSFRNNGNDRSYVVEYTINSASTWEKKTITLTLDQSGGTENYANGVGLSIIWTIASGSTFQTSQGSWQNGNFLATSNQVNGTDNAANDFWLSQVKLEKSSVVTPFVKKPFGLELALCQRYYFKTFPIDTTPAQNAGLTGALRFIAGKAGAAAQFGHLRFPVQMRAAATITFFNPSAANAQVRDTTGGVDCSATASANVSADDINITATGNAATAVGNALDIHLTAEADF